MIKKITEHFCIQANRITRLMLLVSQSVDYSVRNFESCCRIYREPV